MNLSAPFVNRPVATTLLTIGLILVGALAFLLLPISPLPSVDIPTIKVSASLPGASPETMAAAVTLPLERSLGRISGITEMTSSSVLGSARIVLQFDLDRDINGAARDVQAALNAASSQLPAGMSANPDYRKVNPADAPVMILGLTSNTMTQGQIYDAASTIIAQKLSQLKGVGEVEIGGSSLPAVRVELNPQALHQYGIGFDNVRTAIAAANSNLPQGALENGERHWQVSSNGQARSAAEYLPVIMGYSNSGASVKLADVANVVNSVQDLRNAGSANGKPAVLVIIKREPNANIIETVRSVTKLLPTLRTSVPAAIDVAVMMERTSTVRASLRDAAYTLVLAVILVILVVLLFLRNGRAALIPGVAVPVSMIGTFAVMYLLDFSLNNLSLMALTIAVGFIVDDTIVVLENVSRHIENGVSPKQAALIGAKEVGSTVLAMSLVLIAVFIPMLFMGGYVGLFVREFVVTLVVAVLISLVVALTTAPMMCARLLKSTETEGRHGRLYQWSERGFAALLRTYERSLVWTLGHAPLTMLILLATICLNVYLYVIIPKGFFPNQDTGQLTGRIQGDQSISFQLMQKKLADFIDIVRADPAVENVVGYTGGAQRNTGSVFVTLKPLSERKESADKIVTRLRARLANEPGATLILNPVQDIRVGGRQSRSSNQYTIQADDLDELRLWEPRIRQALAQQPELLDVDTDDQSKGLQTSLIVDRDAAARLGISPKQIDTVLNDAFAQRSVSTIYVPLNQYRVVMGVAPEYGQSAEALDRLLISGPEGKQVPLSILARHTQTETSLQVNHHSQLAASTISFNLPKGVSLSKATQVIERTMREIGVPTSVRGGFQGSARAFREVLDNQPILILAAFLTLYIVLGVLYESLIHPLTILSTLPSAGVGALLALMLFRTDFSVIAMIGIFMLIGIVMKNAIMMIDFALDAQRSSAVAPREAIFQACLMRFRPILMTSLAALLAAIPLALGHGDGAEMRQPLGIAIGGGLIMSQLLTLYTTPVVYLYLDRFYIWARSLWQRRYSRPAKSFSPVTDPML
ncbi:multidrug efflux pump RND permease subunit MdtC [Candidatus Nitrotoga sp. BS]|uniref:efflux RND transporter permease subunit n=1 Tax=Candidatus Nitrotoga sp. BS TaxID=2890408 RepID=UPI001EF20893|nr:efflux RND transporter permease subunit [Candidatus Nitrotoga sp. BS]CAH1199908.1 multidrug efflux pump RND permease subunit MdtC [Candidatus Nitrotoga sp. BS]